ncbi:MAG: translation elongation factor 1 alpha-related protein [Candidatus Methanoplasma sp.]|jgi:selenocysteine-specific translation elongation factor|nr:translation elongation factor 1 alpha-related protein [Candidatus Methanoplasma sp.]
MGNMNVAVLGAAGLAGQIGKKGTATDMTFFELKRGQDSVTLIEPTKYPEKLSSLFYSVGMSEFAILAVEKIDAALGEQIVMADMFGIRRGWVLLRNYIQMEQLAPLIAGTSLEGFEAIEEDCVKMREALLDMAQAEGRKAGEGSCGSCPVDSHFNVKGVGTVVLGSVIDGHFRKHDKMRALPLGREVVLKSIQKHDVDAEDGVRGDHVGLALRGVDSEELDRGHVLTTDPSVKMSKRIEGRAELIRYWPSPLREGMVLHVGHWMQMVPFRVASVDDSGGFRSPIVSMEAEADMIYKPGDRAVMMYLEGGKLRIAGSIGLV